MVTAALTVATPAAAQVTPDPGFQAESAASFVRAQQRGIDQASNPEYIRRYAPFVQEYFTIEREDPNRMSDVDPFRHDWAPDRGRQFDVQLKNRYGARLDGELFLPPTNKRAPFPLVILLGGGRANEQQYRGTTQTLAENGYAVLGVGVQGDYGSQQHAPDSKYCQPGAWQEPQEMGIRELGPCAGENPDAEEPGSTVDLVNLLATRDPKYSLAYYEKVRAGKTFGALDWLDWAVAPDNPYRELIDETRIGLVGHSLGAHGALLAGNGDPLGRVDAVVSLDGFGGLLKTTEPRVPTMFQHAEDNALGGPARQKPGPESLPGHVDARRFQAADVPTMTVTLGGSAHFDFQWFPLNTPGAFRNASRDGERVSVHYTLAWFDRWLRPSKKKRASATKRLLTAEYGNRVDRSSIGQGHYDLVNGKNIPPVIAGETAEYHLSPFFTSWADFPGGHCADVRAGC